MRTNFKSNPTAILTADWHLRDTIPACRTDDFEKAQWQKVRYISNLQKKYNCPILHAGDLFDNWKPSPYLLSKTIEFIPDQFYTIYGNHDLPQHNLELAEKCGINVLEKANKIHVLTGTHWNQMPKKENEVNIKKSSILIWHVMTYQGKKPFPGITDSPAAGLLRKYPEYDLILTGHNHKIFTESYENRLLVNPGCITRQESNQANFQPKIFLYFSETNTIQSIDIPVKKDVVVKPENIQVNEARNERINAFIEKLNEGWNTTINFSKNMENYLSANKIPKEIKDIINEIIN